MSASSRSKAPCLVCGTSTTADFGICAGTKECRRVREAKRRAVIAAALEYEPCEVCGKPTPNDCGVCRRTFACQAEYDRRCGTEMSGKHWRPCEVCGNPTASKYGVCQGSDACKQEVTRRWLAANPGAQDETRRAYYQANRETRIAYVREWRASNKELVRQMNRKYRAANHEHLIKQQRAYSTANAEILSQKRRRRYAENRAVFRARWHAQMQRLDRPCRNASAGCTEFAIRNSNYCREHHNLAGKLWRDRKRNQLAAKLAGRQNMKCPWCSRPLPKNLALGEIDHIIPRSSGVIIEDEWNLQLLHGKCNRSKAGKITPQALELARKHGVGLPSVADEPAA